MIPALLIAAHASAALAGGPFDIPFDGGRRWHSSPDAHLAFRLPARWVESNGSEDQLLPGNFERDVDLGHGATCTLSLYQTSRAARRRPKLRGRVVAALDAPIRVVRRGRPGRAVAWVSGPRAEASSDSFKAHGVRRLAPGFASRAYRWVVIDFELSRQVDRFGPATSEGYPPEKPTKAQERACTRLQARSVTVMDAAIGSARVVRT